MLAGAFALEKINALFLSALFKREVVLSGREISTLRTVRGRSIFNRIHLRDAGRASRFGAGVGFTPNHFGGCNDLEDS